MTQLICLIWGILSVAGMLLAFVPCLGFLNWANIPLAIIGLGFSAVTYSKLDVHANRTNSKIGMILCGVAVLFGAFRLFLGGGLF